LVLVLKQKEVGVYFENMIDSLLFLRCLSLALLVTRYDAQAYFGLLGLSNVFLPPIAYTS
jgi:hypothetical protein